MSCNVVHEHDCTVQLKKKSSENYTRNLRTVYTVLVLRVATGEARAVRVRESASGSSRRVRTGARRLASERVDSARWGPNRSRRRCRRVRPQDTSRYRQRSRQLSKLNHINTAQYSNPKKNG